MSIQWTPDLATGASDIDEQHKELFRQLDNLLKAWKNSTGREETEKIILFLNGYAGFHFGTEEKYMDKFGYTNASAHKAQHVDWFVNHIRYSDKALGLFLKRKM